MAKLNGRVTREYRFQRAPLLKLCGQIHKMECANRRQRDLHSLASDLGTVVEAVGRRLQWGEASFFTAGELRAVELR